MAHVFEAELLEREVELGVLRDLMKSAKSGAGAVAVVEGPAGIGKTCLLWEAVAVAREGGFVTVSARASEFEREFAFGVVRQLFEPALAGVAPARRRRLFAGAARLAAPLFESLEADELNPRVEAAQAALHGLYWLVVNMATDEPIVIAVDDGQWADGPSLRFLAYLVNRVGDLPVLVVVCVRPPERGGEVDLLDELAVDPVTRVIRPASLSRGAVDKLVGFALAGDPDPRFSAACFEATKGNPLLVSEVLAALEAEGVAPTRDQADAVLELGSISVARSVARRMRHLGSAATTLAQAVAVLGDDRGLTVAGELAGLDAASADSAAQALRRAGILSTGTLGFVHPVVRGAIYSELSPERRAREHRAAAAILAAKGGDEDEIALHVLASAPGGDRWVVDVLRGAAGRARSRGAPDVAASYLERALAEPPPANRVEVLVELGLAELSSMRLSGLDRLREALALADDAGVRATIALRLGRSLVGWAYLAEAADVLDRALAELGGSHPDLSEKLEAQRLSVALPQASLRSPATEQRTAVLLEQRDTVSDPVLLATLAGFAVATIHPAAVGAELAERALATGDLSVEEEPVGIGAAAVALMAADRLDQSKGVWDQAIARAGRRGSPAELGFASTFRAFVLVRLGAISAAAAHARGTLELLDRRLLLVVPFLLTSLIDCLLEGGELKAADQLLARYELTRELPDLLQMNYLLETRGRLRIAQDRGTEGITDLRECGRRLDSRGVLNPGVIPWRVGLAPALVAAGQADEARDLARREIELARAFEVPRELGMALRAAGLVERDAHGIELLREAVTVLETSAAKLEHARALTDLGAALRRNGQRAEAREPLRIGLDQSQRCGATALAHRAHTELVATGARPRRLVLRGADALTPSERRVAEMAAEGHTNRQIAQGLFITEKTVEGHLGHAYQKLDISSRSQLPDALN